MKKKETRQGDVEFPFRARHGEFRGGVCRIHVITVELLPNPLYVALWYENEVNETIND